MKKRLCLFLNLIFVSLSIAQVKVSMPDTSAETGSFLLLPIIVSDLTNLNIVSYQMSLRYDHEVIKPTDITVENTLTESWGTLVYNLNTPGLIEVGAYDVDPLAGGGKLVNIQFEMVGQPFDSTDLIFEFYEFSHDSITVETKDGKLRLTSNIIDVIITANRQESITIIVDDTTRNLPYQTNWIKGSIHTLEAPSPQQTGVGIQYLFSSWSDSGTQKHTVSSRIDTSFIANFSVQYFLTIGSKYGNPQGQAWYDSGSVVLFSIEDYILEGDSVRHRFESWTGIGDNSYTGTERMSSVMMTNPITQLANWSTEYYLKINSPYGNPFGQGWYVSGETVDFGIDSTVISNERERYLFNSWTGKGKGSYSGTNPQDRVTMQNPITEIANWDEEYYVAIGSNPEGLIEIPGSGWYQAGTQFKTIIAPDTIFSDTTIYLFKQWLVDGKIISGNPITVNVDSGLTILANYEQTFKISGFISEGENILKGVRLIITGSKEDTVHSDHNGYYEFPALFNGSYEIIPFKYGYRFEPERREYNSLKRDKNEQNFLAIDTLSAVKIGSTDEVANNFSLGQNYPNPFNGATVIQYQLPQKATVTLKVYNLLGQPIRTLISGTQEAGNYSVKWESNDDFGNQLPSGIYFYRLNADNIMASKKMIMLE